MPNWFYPLLRLLIELYHSCRDAQIRLHKAQIEIVLARLGGNRIILSPQERSRLLKIGEELNHQIKDSIHIVTFKTYQRWVREKRDGKKPRGVGRPRTQAWIRKLII